MDFWTLSDECHQTVTHASGEGERLQVWARGAFREQFLVHGDSRNEACRACESGRMLVNGNPAAGRTVLRTGDTVTLRLEQSRSQGREDTPRCKRRRMDLQGGAAAEQSQLGNESFSAYYREQQLCDKATWDRVEDALKQPLPVSVRVNLSSHLCEQTLAELAEHAAEERWLSQGTGMVLNSSQDGSDVLELLQKAQSSGELVQQEIASMLPVELLMKQLGPRTRALDMCAAPGSKTTQMLDSLAKIAGCVLIANDVDPFRAERTRRRCLTQPRPASLVVTCHDAVEFIAPRITDGAKVVRAEFDRILCDVPCSGTIRLIGPSLLGG